jgi:hypothetical protein
MSTLGPIADIRRFGWTGREVPVADILAKTPRLLARKRPPVVDDGQTKRNSARPNAGRRETLREVRKVRCVDRHAQSHAMPGS